MSDIQKNVQAAIDELVESGAERGVQVAVYRNGEQIVDAVAGVADPETGREVTSGTLFYNFSIGKGATATVAHVLAERGLFGYDTPIAELWPEFGAHGKEGVTIRQALNHTAGVPGIPVESTVEDICDWDKMCAAIADAEPWWEPGTQMGYHAYSFGYIVGEVVRRATGKPISQVLLEEVAGPLGVGEELYFGMPVAEHGRLAVLEDEPVTADAFGDMPTDLPMFRAGPMTLFPSATLGNRTDVLAADIPAGGKTSARAIARMYAALLGEMDGVRLVSPERLSEMTAVSFSGPDQVFGMPSTWGLGYALGGPSSDTPTAFGMAGAGGSYAYADTATGLVVAVTKNKLTGDFAVPVRVAEIVAEA
ncbi:serine hydrolase domain-containing protein [Acrocarpospora catenulata]|uniref:serine hydrolase domain-containing protein n=1 Tax=Acrocarpospora catenulata TaxID=2836182 RepID=UPI001BD9B9DB|nr:serine hydrolase domain-containing protein [Acrocarpospora catenulata]